MSAPSIPSLHSAKASPFKTIVAWVCGPIVLLELIVLIIAVAVAMVERTDEKTFTSYAKLLVGGAEVNPKLENGEPIPDSFYATNLELLQSAEVIKNANARARSLHPDMAPHYVRIEALRVPDAHMIVVRATSEDGLCAQATLDAVLDEFLLTRKELRTRAGTPDFDDAAFREELVRIEKEMIAFETRIKDAEQRGAAAADLESDKSKLARLKKTHDDIVSDWRKMSADPRRKEVISVFERASPALAVVPKFSIFR